MEIQGYPNYLIYEDGRVFSKERFDKTNHLRKGKFLAIKSGKQGYTFVSISNEKGRKNKYIHRLIAIHYLPNLKNKPDIDHINRIKDDNRIENLRWVNSSENNLNKIVPKTTNFHWISKLGNRYQFQKCFRENKRIVKHSKSIPQLLCYSFFYLLKYPEA